MSCDTILTDISHDSPSPFLFLLSLSLFRSNAPGPSRFESLGETVARDKRHRIKAKRGAIPLAHEWQIFRGGGRREERGVKRQRGVRGSGVSTASGVCDIGVFLTSKQMDVDAVYASQHYDWGKQHAKMAVPNVSDFVDLSRTAPGDRVRSHRVAVRSVARYHLLLYFASLGEPRSRVKSVFA